MNQTSIGWLEAADLATGWAEEAERSPYRKRVTESQVKALDKAMRKLYGEDVCYARDSLVEAACLRRFADVAKIRAYPDSFEDEPTQPDNEGWTEELDVTEREIGE